MYAIVLCAAGLNGHCYSSPVIMSNAFDSNKSCVAALPAFATGNPVSEDGRDYITKTRWYECVKLPSSS